MPDSLFHPYTYTPKITGKDLLLDFIWLPADYVPERLNILLL